VNAVASSALGPRATPRAGLRSPRPTLPPFQRFLDSHRDAVWRFLVSSVGRSEAEDCFQETFIAALRAYPRLRPDSNLRAWVLTIAHRKALDAHRGRTRRALPVADPGAVDGRSSTPAPARDDALWEAVGELPERQRSAVLLRFLADLPHRDIAAAIGCSEQAARRSLHEGLVKLRKVVPA
jgi:RNA polymerase sigma factor (sigma-70 family)